MTKSLVFKVPIGIAAHNQAQQFSHEQANPEKAKQVYLNTLAVWSVKAYINSIGWETSLETSNSWNPILQSLMNVADLDIPNCGKLECRVISTNTNCINVPAEVWSERIGYIVVKLSKSLREAKLLGFVSQLNEGRILLSQLKSLAEFPAYLNQTNQQTALSQPVQLSQWLEGVFELSWQQLDNLLLPPTELSFRNSSQLAINNTGNCTENARITRVKVIELESSSHTSQIALILSIRSQQAEEIEISVKVCPTYICTHLPHDLEIVVLDEKDQPVMQAQAQKTESIEFRFSGDVGEYFSIKASLNNFSRVEKFVI